MSDLCKYINNAYTDAAPYEAVALIVHTDVAVVQAFQDFYPNGRHGLSPVMAAGIYGAGGPTGPFTGLPWVFVPTLPFGLDINVPNATQATSTVIDTCGNRVSYDWVIFLVLGGPTVAVDPGAEAIRTRRFHMGFEMPDGEGVSGGGLAGVGVSRNSSRVPGGLGMMIRSNSNQFVVGTVNLYGAVTDPKNSWERFYLRPFQFDASRRIIWRVYGSVFPAGGVAIAVLSNGAISIREFNSIATEFTILAATTETIPLDRWSRIDAVVNFGNGGATSGRLRVWLNGTLIVDVQSTQADGLGQNGNHTQTDFGTRDTTHNLEIDMDDWHNAETPVLFNGLDWISGSHIQLVRASGDGPGRANWTGDWRIALQLPAVTSGQLLTSSTASARLELTADPDRLEPLGVYQLGVVSTVVAVNSRSAGGNGQLGIAIDGGADNLAVITETPSLAFRARGIFPVGLTAGILPDPMRLIYLKAADASAAAVAALMATVECLGSWGIEDQPPGGVIDPVPDSGIHNGPYWEHVLYQGGPGAPPFGEVVVEAGLYTGNGTGQDLPKSGPGHWLFVRGVPSSGGDRVTWWSSMISPHVGISGNAGMDSETMVQALIDAAGQAQMRVAGNIPFTSNVLGATYQWVMVSDPAMRYLICGSFGHFSPQTIAATTPLVDSNFFPEAGFFFQETISILGGGSRFWYKGPGHATANAQKVDGGETANVVSFALGSLLTQTPIHDNQSNVAYALWRNADGGGPPGGDNCDPNNSGRPAALTSYVGNGAGGNRTIPLALNGRRPLLAIVQPHNSFARFRDPSHTGTETGRVDNGGLTGSTTEITGGGVDFITVGVTLNASGVVYEVFALAGDVGGSGWGTNGVYYPVPPGERCDGGGPWPPNPPPPEPPVPPGAACSTGDFPTELT